MIFQVSTSAVDFSLKRRRADAFFSLREGPQASRLAQVVSYKEGWPDTIEWFRTALSLEGAKYVGREVWNEFGQTRLRPR